jgi:hypothetical protein
MTVGEISLVYMWCCSLQGPPPLLGRGGKYESRQTLAKQIYVSRTAKYCTFESFIKEEGSTLRYGVTLTPLPPQVPHERGRKSYSSYGMKYDE